MYNNPALPNPVIPNLVLILKKSSRKDKPISSNYYTCGKEFACCLAIKIHEFRI